MAWAWATHILKIERDSDRIWVESGDNLAWSTDNRIESLRLLAAIGILSLIHGDCFDLSELSEDGWETLKEAIGDDETLDKIRNPESCR